MEVAGRRRTLQGIVVVLVAVVLIVSGLAAYYYSQYNQVESENSTYVQQLRQLDVDYSSHILIDFGNGTRVWFNDTKFQPGLNLYAATEVITDGHINSTYYPEFSSHLVTAIYNIGNAGNDYWGIWTYNSTASWQMAPVGADQLQVYSGSVFAWTYGPNESPP